MSERRISDTKDGYRTLSAVKPIKTKIIMDIKSKNISIKAILIIIVTGIWIGIFQNAGIIPTTQRVRVTNTVNTDSRVTGEVEIENTVDVNIEAINGYNTVTTGKGTHSVFPYGYMLPVESW